jgi:hypothetical protein
MPTLGPLSLKEASSGPLLGALTIVIALLVRLSLMLWPNILRRFYIAPPSEWERGEPSADASSDAPSADQAYFSFAQKFHENQLITNDNFDSKATGILEIGSTVLPLTFGLLAISERKLPILTIWCLGLAVLAYACLLVFVIRAAHIRGFEYRPTLRALAENTREFDGVTIRRWIAEEYSVSVELNRPLLERKSRHVGRAYIALLIEGAMVSIGALATLLWGGY